MYPSLPSPEWQERGEGQGSCGIAEPPGPPDQPVLTPRRKSSQDKTSYAKRCRHRTAHTAIKCETQNVPGPFERAASVGIPDDEKGGYDRFQSVARGNADRSEDRTGGGAIDEKGPCENERPQAQTDRQPRPQREALRGPHTRRAR